MAKTTEYINNMCELSTSLFGYPVRYLSASYGDIEILSSILRKFKADGKKINYRVYANSFIHGYVELDGGCLLVGPAVVDVCDMAVAKKLISSFYRNYSATDDEADGKMQHAVENARYVSVGRFIAELCLIASPFFDEPISPDDVLGEAKLEKGAKALGENVIEKERDRLYFGGEQSDMYNIESTVASYVRKGEAEKLLDYLYTVNYFTVRFGSDSLRHLKNSAIILNNILNRAAIEGGVSKVFCFQLGEINIQQIEACTSIETLNVVAMSFAREYCEKVRKIRGMLTDYDDINAAIRYIDEHLHERIKVSDVAKTVFLSPEYLSVKFHKAVGDTIPSYINRRKIEKAKDLLTLSEMPVGEISEYLAFSSQSYFQNIFKKYVEMTPKEYRESAFSADSEKESGKFIQP